MKIIYLKLIFSGLVCMIIAGQPSEALLLQPTSPTYDQGMILQARTTHHHRRHHGHAHHRGITIMDMCTIGITIMGMCTIGIVDIGNFNYSSKLRRSTFPPLAIML